ncbi:Hypothetical protein SRAE_2000395900 [Strongyloides ratti]|uniref:Uncharacterized protein n=1 Tax=Strongyloides ratti TaxID=34506 RepID=A0A090MZP8_STRRB|nr:Hypothetical protein SRAE_2000395900 [Strongyloides ratti]CEF69309.1 Hypothetical protein SRAE_2000395900 [Strongyloides ratti]
MSLTSDGNKNEWKTVINDDGNINILEKIPTLKNILQKYDNKNEDNLIHKSSIRKKNPTNYRRAPIIYEWTSPSKSNEDIFNNFFTQDNSHEVNTPFKLSEKENEIKFDTTTINYPFNQKSLKFFQSPQYFNSHYNHKMDFSIPWFGARFFEKHQPIPSSVSLPDFVRQHTINTYGNGRHLFDEMQVKLNNLFKDFNF